MNVWCVLAIASAPAFDATDIPVGTDVAVRIEVGKVLEEVQAAWVALSPLGAAHAPLATAERHIEERWLRPLGLVESHLRADWKRAGGTAVVAVDLDAPGGVLWSAAVRGAIATKPTPGTAAGVETFRVDDHPAYRLVAEGLAWSVVRDNVLVLGDERGLQRHVRHIIGPTGEQGELAREAARVRVRAPLVVAFALSETTREQAKELLPVVGSFLREVVTGHLAVDARRVVLTLQTRKEQSRDALVHGLRALAAALRARAAHLETGAEALLGLGGLPTGVPGLPGVEADTLSSLTRDWLTGFSLAATVRARAKTRVEAELTPSSMRGLLAVAGEMLLGLVENAATRIESALPVAAKPVERAETTPAKAKAPPAAGSSSAVVEETNGVKEGKEANGAGSAKRAKDEKDANGKKAQPTKEGDTGDKASGAELHQL
jgi:hypothetical protein